MGRMRRRLYLGVIVSTIIAGAQVLHPTTVQAQETARQRYMDSLPKGTRVEGLPFLPKVKPTEEDMEILWNKAAKKNVTYSLGGIPTLHSEKEFTAFNTIKNENYTITAKLKRINKSSYIYVDKKYEAAITEDQLNQISAEFEKIYAKDVEYFGSVPDVDQDKRIYILLTDIDEDGSTAQEGDPYIAGYFDASNQLPKELHPKSNEKEMFYMDIAQGNPSDPDKMKEFFGTLAHEFQHMIQYNTYFKNWPNVDDLEETWLDEGLADYASYINTGTHPVSHVYAYLSDPQNVNLMQWEDTLGNYGASYMFTLHMAQQYGKDFIYELAQNPKLGEESINEVARSRGTNFEDMFHKWMIANAINDPNISKDGSFGYTTESAIDFVHDLGKGVSSPWSSTIETFSDYSSEIQGTLRAVGYSGDRKLFYKGNANANALAIHLEDNSGTYYAVKAKKEGGIQNLEDFFASTKTIMALKPGEHNEIPGLGTEYDALMLIGVANNIRALGDYFYDGEWNVVGTGFEVYEVGYNDLTTDTSPEAPKVIATETLDYSVALQWEPVADDKGALGYYVYRDGQLLNPGDLVRTLFFQDYGLAPSTSYKYEVAAVDGAGNTTTGSSITIHTAAQRDAEAPTAPEIQYVSTGDGGVTLKLTKLSTDNVSQNLAYKIVGKINGKEFGVHESVLSSANLGEALPFGNLQNDVTYELYPVAFDEAGNMSVKGSSIFVKVNQGPVAVDTKAPMAPTDLKITSTNAANGSITFAWNQDVVDIDMDTREYNVFRDGMYVGKTIYKSFTDTGLQVGSWYTYTVEALDHAGNESPSSASFKARIDVIKPTVPTSFITTGKTSSTVDLSWSAATDDIGISGYDIYRNGAKISTVAGTSYHDTGLSSSTIYHYKIAAVDISLNKSDESNEITVTTDAIPVDVIPTSPPSAGGGGGGGGAGGGGGTTGEVLAQDITPKEKEILKDLNEIGNALASSEVHKEQLTSSIKELLNSVLAAKGAISQDIQKNVQSILEKSIQKLTTLTAKQSASGNNAVIDAATISQAVDFIEQIKKAAAQDAGLLQTVSQFASKMKVTVPENNGIKMELDKKIVEQLKLNNIELQYTLKGADVTISSDTMNKYVKEKDVVALEIYNNKPNQEIQDLIQKDKAAVRFGNMLEVKMISSEKTNLSTNEALQIRVDVNAYNNKKLVGVYEVTAAGIKYVNGKLEENALNSMVEANKKYIVLEYNKDFKDVTGWATEYVKQAAAKQVVQGVTEDTFNPDSNITRAEFAALVTRTLQQNPTAYQGGLKDVDANAWYKNDIQTAIALGIIRPDQSNRVAPEQKITRQEMVTMLMRAYEMKKKEAIQVDDKVIFKDMNQISDYAKEAVLRANKLGIIGGKQDNTFDPIGSATRAEAAKVIIELLNQLQ